MLACQRLLHSSDEDVQTPLTSEKSSSTYQPPAIAAAGGPPPPDESLLQSILNRLGLFSRGQEFESRSAHRENIALDPGYHKTPPSSERLQAKSEVKSSPESKPRSRIRIHHVGGTKGKSSSTDEMPSGATRAKSEQRGGKKAKKNQPIVQKPVEKESCGEAETGKELPASFFEESLGANFEFANRIGGRLEQFDAFVPLYSVLDPVHSRPNRSGNQNNQAHPEENPSRGLKEYFGGPAEGIRNARYQNEYQRERQENHSGEEAHQDDANTFAKFNSITAEQNQLEDKSGSPVR